MHLKIFNIHIITQSALNDREEKIAKAVTSMTNRQCSILLNGYYQQLIKNINYKNKLKK